MANVQHASLTGADLHEPKGAASASDGDVLTANSGIAVWTADLELDSVTLNTSIYKYISIPPAPGASTVQTVGDFELATFAAAATDTVFTTFVIPNDYESSEDVKIKLHWIKADAGAGNVEWEVSAKHGSTTDTDTNVDSTGTIDALTFTTTDRPVMLSVSRDGTAANDTYSGNAYLIAIEVVYKSVVIGADSD